MNHRELSELIELVCAKGIAEFELDAGEGFRLRIVQSAKAGTVAPVAAPPPAVPERVVAAPAATVEPPAEAADLHVVKSPIVGTFYRSASPTAEPYVKVGDTIKKGQVLCIIEAMKLMNELECEVSGTIAEICVENAQPVEYGQVLFRVDPA